MLSVRQNNDAIRKHFNLTLLPAEQQSNRGSIAGSVEDLLYSAPTHTGAHHRYIQRPEPHRCPPSLHTAPRPTLGPTIVTYSAPTHTGAHHRYIQRPDPHWGPPLLHTAPRPTLGPTIVTYSAPTHNGAHHRYIQCCANEDSCSGGKAAGA